MKFQETEISGVFVISSEMANDVRGFFVRLHAQREFAERGLEAIPEQCSLSYNRQAGTVRGLHYQAPPHAEAKLVCCVAGRMFDVVVDLRRASPTYGRALWFTLTPDPMTTVYVPKGCAHGFQTLEADTTLLYLISAPYHASAALGIRWDDPALGVPWPRRENVVLSDRDKSLPWLSDLDSPF